LSGIEKSLIELIQSWYLHTGYLGILLAMTLESCCIPLPSEIVMPLAGYFVYQSTVNQTGQFSLWGVALVGAIGCLLGSTIAYIIGATGGRPLLLKYGKYILISKADSDRADRWFQRHGAPVAFFSRLLPVVRTYISLPAGIAEMKLPQFLLFTFLGSLPWTFALAWLGMWLGDQGKITDPTMLPDRLGGIFHGLDAVILIALVAAVAYYVYRHVKHDREARASDVATEPELPAHR
jgi:membrane protein DedA with SNARE-associated domain